jgi:hypothetical protein
LSEAPFTDPLDEIEQPIDIHGPRIGYPAVDLFPPSPAQRQFRFQDLAHAAREAGAEELWFECTRVDKNAVPLAAPKDRCVGEIGICGARLNNLKELVHAPAR